MFSQKVILALSMLAIATVNCQTVHAIQYEPVDESKFLGRIGNHFSMLHSFTDQLMKLFMIKDAELMSSKAKQHILFDMADKDHWYNESISDVWIPTFQDLQQKFNGNLTGNLTQPNLISALATYSAQVFIVVNQTMQQTLMTEFSAHELKNKDGSPTGWIDEEGYNNISYTVFPEVKPYINMIDNTKGPFSLHFTLDYHGEAENYKLFENQTNVLLMGYNNQTWTLGNESLVKDVQYNNSYIIYADPTVSQGNIVQFPTPANFFQPTLSRPFWLGWQRVGNPIQHKVAFAYTDPRVSYDSTDRYGPPTQSAKHLALLLGTSVSMLIALII